MFEDPRLALLLFLAIWFISAWGLVVPYNGHRRRFAFKFLFGGFAPIAGAIIGGVYAVQFSPLGFVVTPTFSLIAVALLYGGIWTMIKGKSEWVLTRSK